MKYLFIALISLVVLALLALIVSSICFFKIFYSFRRNKKDEENNIPKGGCYDPYRAQMIDWIKNARLLDHKDLSITSFDGLKLCGKYYEYKKGAPIEILFHGYRSSSLRDLSGGIYRCFSIGHNALIVDQRACGNSEGKVITFGAKESRDCRFWIDYVIQNIDENAKIIITGISMGAATVMITAGEDLPENVIGVLADCGYSSAEDIIKKVMGDMKLPANILYPFAKLGARIFGGFDINKASPIKAMQKCKLPVIFYHGDEDSYVPCYMSQENYFACASNKKRLVIIPGAEHGICYPVDMNTYVEELATFFNE